MKHESGDSHPEPHTDLERQLTEKEKLKHKSDMQTLKINKQTQGLQRLQVQQMDYEKELKKLRINMTKTHKSNRYNCNLKANSMTDSLRQHSGTFSKTVSLRDTQQTNKSQYRVTSAFIHSRGRRP